ncbi:MAG: HAD-IB family phosphatase [Candidatus Omnitrophica bacterium]|nr:HAD-IB family phosphatase [Candidatus Omnitrophota bacterium]
MDKESVLSKDSKAGILVTDFDGTMTRFDFYDLVCQAFPQIAGDFWPRYEQGELTHFEALRLIFGGIRASEHDILEIVNSMQIEPKLADAVKDLSAKGWSVVVASAGCDWYIRRLLKNSHVDITVHANPGEFSSQKGLVMRLPEASPFFSADLGVNKVFVVKDALQRSAKVAFAGDGRPDLAPALLVSPERRFAKSWLAKKLHEIGESFVPFDHWDEVARALLKEDRNP